MTDVVAVTCSVASAQVTSALQTAAELCAARGVRLTPLRHCVLELIWRSPKPLGAYPLLEALQHLQARRVAPPTVYRCLDFLVEQGLIHRLASLNAYVGCPRPNEPHPGQFFICTRCGSALETTDATVVETIRRRATESGFIIEQQVIEIMGCCAQCQQLG